MERRRFLLAAASAGIVGFSGCVSSSDDESQPNESDGEADDVDIDDDYETDVAEGEVDGTDERGYETYSVIGQSVPLAPTDDVYEWYQNDAVVMADARPKRSFDEVHITGAYWSPAPDGQEADDPLADLGPDTRIVTYCACPHHLSGRRAAELRANGYTNVFALDNGIQDWADKGYPIEGEEV
jgi:rhodanese-related sulfurtransferase